jgi:hypothetical protein
MPDTNKETEVPQCVQTSVMPCLFFYRIVFKDEKDKPAYTVRKAESEPLAIQDFIRLNPKTKIYRVDFLNEA